MVLAFVLSMFIDSITVILFLAAITITQGKLLKFDPIPIIIAEIFCSNLGGSSTMCGDPPNIIIGTRIALHIYRFSVQYRRDRHPESGADDLFLLSMFPQKTEHK